MTEYKKQPWLYNGYLKFCNFSWHVWESHVKSRWGYRTYMGYGFFDIGRLNIAWRLPSNAREDST